MVEEVFIIGYSRTPIGGFLGNLSTLSCTELGAIATDALNKSNIEPGKVDAVYFGNVLSANVGQAPATQVSIASGIPAFVPTTTINKVCASGMKAIAIGAQDIMLGNADIVVAGGMESMSNVPHYLLKHRSGNKYGHQELVDGIIKDGLFDVYNRFLMGDAAELCAREHQIDRKMQDEYTILSYTRAIEAHEKGVYAKEIVPVEINVRGKNHVIDKDEEISNFSAERTINARPVFQSNGTVTASSSSTLSDGASAVIIASGKAVKELNLRPIAKILSFADASQEPEKFTTAPSLAVPIALKKCSLNINDVDLFEINEAFSVVALANTKILGIPVEKCNIYGGGVSIGHPLGSSGSRIVGTLLTALQNINKRTGVAAVCNGGGGASAMVVQLC